MVNDGMSNFIFTTRSGMLHIPSTVNRTIKRIVEAYNAEEEEKAGCEGWKPVLIPEFSCRILSHTFTSSFCGAENTVKTV